MKFVFIPVSIAVFVAFIADAPLGNKIPIIHDGIITAGLLQELKKLAVQRDKFCARNHKKTPYCNSNLVIMFIYTIQLGILQINRPGKIIFAQCLPGHLFDPFFLDGKNFLCYDNKTMPAWWNR